MDLQKYLGELTANNKGKDSFLKLDNRPGFIMDQAKLFSDSGSALERTHPQGMAEWEAIKLYDKVDVKLAPTVETKGVYSIDESKFTEEDVNNIYWDPINRNYFTIKFDDAGVVQIDQTMEASYGDPENNYMDSNLQELNSIIENKKSAEIIQSGDETDENDLTKIVVENKLEEGMVHPTVDGTPEGEISEEYIDEYASKNKIVFDQRKKDSAFKYFSRKRGGKTIYELIQEGKLTMAPQHAPYLDEYKESLQTVVAQAN
jgi:ABC-type antimicrobial peptide transport system permease subunit